MDSLPVFAADSFRELIPIVAIAGGILLAMIGMIASACYKSSRLKEAERTKREIAAYVAEGSISPEDGERLMQAAGHRPVDKA